MKPLSEMSVTEKNREACGIFKIQWHEIVHQESGGFASAHTFAKCSCGVEFSGLTMRLHIANNPDFATDPVRLLREIEKLSDAFRFFHRIGHVEVANNGLNYYVLVKVITGTTGKLLDAFLEWERGKG